jgi:hypothetical protein
VGTRSSTFGEFQHRASNGNFLNAGSESIGGHQIRMDLLTICGDQSNRHKRFGIRGPVDPIQQIGNGPVGGKCTLSAVECTPHSLAAEFVEPRLSTCRRHEQSAAHQPVAHLCPAGLIDTDDS